MRGWRGMAAWVGLTVLMAGTLGSGEPPPASFPDACPALPEGAVPIAGLASGQAVESGGSTTLRFSSKMFACGEWSDDASDAECFDWYNFRLTVPTSALTPGSHRLSELGVDFGEMVVHASPEEGQGCKADYCKMSVNGTGTVAVDKPEATLEIHAVTDSCITGALSGVHSPFAGAPDYSGAFFALRCR